MDDDGPQSPFELIFVECFALGVWLLLNATLVPTGRLSLYSGTKFKVPALTRSFTAVVPCFSDPRVHYTIICSISTASAYTALLFLRLYNARVRSLISSSTHRRRSIPIAVLVSLPWVFLSVLLAGGERQLYIFWGVAFVSCMSMAFVGAFKLVADYRDSSTAAMWVIGQSIAIVLFLCRRRCFFAAIPALLPILPAIYALWIRIDNLYIISLDPAKEEWRRFVAFASAPAAIIYVLIVAIVSTVTNEC